MTLHVLDTAVVLRVSTREYSRADEGVKWCFHCRKRVSFSRVVSVPTDPMSYYGPTVTIVCGRGHHDGDCFPGTWREWADEC